MLLSVTTNNSIATHYANPQVFIGKSTLLTKVKKDCSLGTNNQRFPQNQIQILQPPFWLMLVSISPFLWAGFSTSTAWCTQVSTSTNGCEDLSRGFGGTAVKETDTTTTHTAD